MDDCQILSGLLIFVLGLAPLLFQITLPAHLREFIWKQRWFHWILALIIINVAVPLVVARSGWIPETVTKIGGLVITFDDAFVVILAHLAAVCYVLYILQLINITRFVELLRNECKKDIRLQRRFDETLAVLIDIGRKSEAGFEKDHVLQALDRLAAYVMAKHLSGYDGTILKPLIRGLEEILVGDIDGSRENLRSAADILETIISTLRNDDRFPFDLPERDQFPQILDCAGIKIG